MADLIKIAEAALATERSHTKFKSAETITVPSIFIESQHDLLRL